MKTSTSTRLGQILVNKGLITAEQLNIALFEQKQRRQLSDGLDKSQQWSLGDILIELGFINRQQLKRSLNWQAMLRKMAIAMSFCAPLMTVSTAALAASTPRPSFTVETRSSSSVTKINPSFTKSSSSISSSSISRAAASSLPKSSSSSSKSSMSSVARSSSSRSADISALKMNDIFIAQSDYDHVQLRWTATGANIIAYKIFRDQVLIESYEGDQLYFDDFNVAAGKTYLYGVSVGDASGNWSPVKSIFVQTQMAPQGIEVSSSSSVSSSAVSQASVSNGGGASSVSSVAAQPSSSSSSQAVSSSKSSSAPGSISSSSSSSSSKSSSVSSSSAQNSSSSSQAGASVAGPVSFGWFIPNSRENGDYLDASFLGGYELRYKKTSDSAFTSVKIADAWTNYHNFTWLEGTYIFQIAAFDKNGLYSNFVDIKPL